jgi:Fe2+ transport system protein B
MQPGTYIPLLIGFSCAVRGYTLAVKRDRSRVIASLVCFVFGIVGLGVYALVTRKPKRQPVYATSLAPMP